MKKIEIEFKLSSTGSYSPWHLDIAHKYDVPLMVTSDIGKFVKIGEDIYNCDYCYARLYEYLIMLEDMNDKGKISDEEVLKEIDDIINNRNKDFQIEKCEPLEEFEKEMIEIKKKQDERNNKGHKTKTYGN